MAPAPSRGGASAEKLAPPDGTRAMMISMREMDTLGLKTGSGLRETVASRTFSKTEILQQISQVGFMCPFHEFRADIAKLQGDDLLIVADPLEVYGENWLVCLTRKAFETQSELLAQREREQLEALAAQAKDAADANSSNDVASIVYEDRPMCARVWVSASAKESRDEVDALSVVSSRPLIKLSLTKMSDELNAECKFSDRDADQCFVEWRQHKDPNYELTRLEQDVGLQGIAELVDNATQTSWFRSVNSALQYAPIVMDAAQQQREMDSDRMLVFLARVLPLVEHALQQNETLDVFCDPFAALHDDDDASQATSKHETVLKELRSFTDLVYSKNKTLSAIDWHPKKTGVVAVAAAANVNFARRLDLLDKVDRSFILVWNFNDLIHPQLMLEAPTDVLTLRFNPLAPHLIAGGLYNGQVLVWDVSKAEQEIAKGAKAKTTAASSSAKHSSASSSHDDTTKQQRRAPIVKPLFVSYIDASHRRPVADLMWLPVGMEVNNRGHVVPTATPAATDAATTGNSNNVHQFVTIAGDGHVCFWDLRFKDPRHRGLGSRHTKSDKHHVAFTTATTAAAAAAKDASPPEVPFTPIYAIALTKVESAGELGLQCFRFERPRDDASGGSGSSSSPVFSSRFYCGTEEGEFVYADWRPHAAATAGSGATKVGGGGGSDAGSRATRDDDESSGSSNSVEYVQWLCRDHFRPVVALCASPFFPSIFVTVSESAFHIWNVAQQHRPTSSSGASSNSSNEPILRSPLSLAPITCAAFSPTRPGVLYIGKSDGLLEVWDFMDQSHRASLSMGITACALTSIEFRPQGLGTAGASSSGSAGSTTSSAGGVGAAAAAIGSKHNASLHKHSAGNSTSTSNGPTTNSSQATASSGVPVKQQLVAIGDQMGNLHIMEIPRPLARATSGERPAIEAYFKRESERASAVQSPARGINTSNRMSTTSSQTARSSVQSGSATARNDTNHAGGGGTGAALPATPATGSSSRATGSDAAVATSTNAIDDDVFKRLESEFCRELGIHTPAA